MLIRKRNWVVYSFSVMFMTLIYLYSSVIYDYVSNESGSSGGNSILGGYQLTSHDGRTFTQADFIGKWSLIHFGYLSCPDVCPTNFMMIARLEKRLAQSNKKIPQFIFVSLDPERDKVSNIKTYVEYFGDNTTGVTGDLANISEIARSFNLYFRKSEVNDGMYSLDHNGSIFLINPRGMVEEVFPFPLDIKTALRNITQKT